MWWNEQAALIDLIFKQMKPTDLAAQGEAEFSP